MNIPTGMNYGTALHFHHVAAQMNAYSNQRSRQNLLSANGLFRQQQPSFGPVQGSPFPSFGGGQFGYGQMRNDQFGAIGRDFMRSLLLQ